VRKLWLALGIVVSTVLATAAPGGAITYGEPDAGEHPYVGLIIYWVPSEASWFSCSGTLLDADTFLTAAHCTYDIGKNGLDGTTQGGTDVWATFKETKALEGFPPRSSFSTPAELYAGRKAWLEANDDFFQGTAFHHGDYDDFAEFPQTYDVGVVELDDTGHGVTTFGELAGLGTADTLAGESGRGRNDVVVENVGYGTQSVQPDPQDEDSRFKSTSRIVEVNGNISDGGNLHTLNNPSEKGGRGGTCFGDSGGPVFVNNTNDVLAVVSFGFSGTCHGADYSWRVDTTDSYNFVVPFLAE